MYPEIYEAQLEAILDALSTVSDKGIPTRLEIAYPHVCSREELDNFQMLTDRVVAGHRLEKQYRANTCVSIDTPRGVFVSKEVAIGLERFSST